MRTFVTSVLGAPHEQFLDRLIIFNTIQHQMASTEACAFIRHAVNCFYRDFTMVDTHDKTFTWQLTFADTVHSFRNAVYTWAETIRIFTAVRRYSNKKKKKVPLDTLTRFNKLVTFSDAGLYFRLTPQFQQAIARADADAAARARRRQ